MTSMQTTAAASERVFEFVDEPEMDNEKNIKKYLKKISFVNTIIKLIKFFICSIFTIISFNNI